MLLAVESYTHYLHGCRSASLLVNCLLLGIVVVVAQEGWGATTPAIGPIDADAGAFVLAAAVLFWCSEFCGMFCTPGFDPTVGGRG